MGALTLTHTHTLNISLSPSPSLSNNHSLSLSFLPSFSQTHTQTLNLSLTLLHPSFSLKRTHTLTLSLSLSTKHPFDLTLNVSNTFPPSPSKLCLILDKNLKEWFSIERPCPFCCCWLSIVEFSNSEMFDLFNKYFLKIKRKKLRYNPIITID